MALHITLNCIKKAWTDFNADHVIFCLEGRSWRKDFYAPYKRNRAAVRSAMTAQEEDEDTAFWEIYEEFTNFVKEKTNCTVIRHPNLEADDLIGGFIQLHPDDSHVIISTDGDFAQLIAPNVTQYNGVANITITHKGYFDDKGKEIIEKATKEPKPAPHPEWQLFEKCMRGDTSDNVFSAYPGVPKKSTKNRVGLLEAFNDKHAKGFSWNNMMLQRWSDHDGNEHRVLDDYHRNVILCDLTAQPQDIRAMINETIDNIETKQVTQVGMRLMKFCAKWDMQRIADQAQSYANALNARYTK